MVSLPRGDGGVGEKVQKKRRPVREGAREGV